MIVYTLKIHGSEAPSARGTVTVWIRPFPRDRRFAGMGARHLASQVPGDTTGQSGQMSRASRRVIRTQRHELIVRIPRIDSKNVLCLADKIIGLQKEIVGRDRLIRSGQVQQHRGAERIQELQAQVKADGHKTNAAAADTAERGT